MSGREDRGDILEADREGEEEHLDPAVTEKLLESLCPLGGALRRETLEEIERREGTWSAFSAGVFRAIDEEARADERMSAEDRAIAAYKSEVIAEVSSMEPRFERSFREGIERQIWQAAKAPPSLFERLRRWAGGRNAMWTGFGLATATACLIALIFLRAFTPGTTESVAGYSSDVSIDQVSFEGTVTVMPADNGMTVVWLASDTSS